jgi:hypothetical protein
VPPLTRATPRKTRGTSSPSPSPSPTGKP